MKILGIGNAIVDVICKVEDKYLLDNKLTKSTMKLVDEVEFKKLLSTSFHLPAGHEFLAGVCIFPLRAHPHNLQCGIGIIDLCSHVSHI